MRFHINLASRPYEDAGDFYRRWGTALALLLVVTLVLVGIAVHEWMSTRSISREIAGIHKQIDTLEDQKNQGQAILNRPENRSTRDRSGFVNELIDLKQFSWTLVMADMETLMPTRIHILSIQPQRNKQGQIEVRITAGSDSTDKGVELLRNLEKSRYFRNPVLRSVVTNLPNQQQGPDIAKFELEAYYTPHLPEKEKAPRQAKPDTGNAAAGNHPAVSGRRRKPAIGARPFTGPHPAMPGVRRSTGE
jgi:Tfp pilus assembly protein PilN